MKIAVITGISGQDGALLANLLLQNHYLVIGTARPSDSVDHFWRLHHLGIFDQVKIIPAAVAPNEIIKQHAPTEIYNLAGQSSVALSFQQPHETVKSNAMASLDWLEGIRTSGQQIKYYQASSSEIFGKPSGTSINEESNFHPKSPYAVSKIFSHFLTINYRESFGIFACNGISSNHESCLRGEYFVTKKIARDVAAIKLGKLDHLSIGNLAAKRDWGHAVDYVRGMHLMMQQPVADDYVLATGKLHSVKDFINVAFAVANMPPLIWKGEGLEEKAFCSQTGKLLVTVDPQYFRPNDLDISLGSSLKAANAFGWYPEFSFSQIVEEMVTYELQHQHG